MGSSAHYRLMRKVCFYERYGDRSAVNFIWAASVTKKKWPGKSWRRRDVYPRRYQKMIWKEIQFLSVTED